MKLRMPFWMLAALCLSLALAVSAAAQEVDLGGAQPKITVASNVRARTGPQVAAQEVTRLRLGTVLSATARSSDEEEIGGKKGYWYRVNLPSGESGWVFGGLLADYDAARREEIVRRIVDVRLKAETMSFDDGVDLYNFVSGAVAGAKDRNTKGVLELLRLHALERSVAGIPYEERERPPYRDWYKAHEGEIYYHELAGVWAVRSEAFWELERKYHGTPVGDRIAWDAAQNLQPGECETDEVCQFLSHAETEGKYLSLYPDGAHASEVLKNFAETLASEDVRKTLSGRGGDQYQAEAREAIKKALAELRASVSKTSRPEKAAVLAKLNRLAPRGR